MKTRFVLFVLLLPLLALTAAEPELPRSRHIYSLGEVPQTKEMPLNPAITGKGCEMCTFTNYETAFSYDTGPEGKISSISWSIVNDVESGPVKSQWQSLQQRFAAHKVRSESEDTLVFNDGLTRMTVEKNKGDGGLLYLRVKVSDLTRSS